MNIAEARDGLMKLDGDGRPGGGLWKIVAAAVLTGVGVSFAPVEAFAAIAGLLLVALFVFRVDMFVLSIALYTPFEEFILKWLPEQLYGPARYSLEAAIVFVFAVSVVSKLSRTGRPTLSTPIDLPVALLIAVIFLSTVFNDVPAFISLLGMKNLVRYIFLFYIVVNADLSEEFWKRLVFALMLVAVAEAALGVVQIGAQGEVFKFFKPADVAVAGETVREYDIVSNKAFGTLGRYNVMGNFLNIVICVAMGLYYAGYRRSKLGYILFFGAALIGLGATFSRMSWVGMYLAFVFILLIQKKKQAIIYILAPVLLTLTLVASYQGLHWYKGETGKASAIERYVSIFSEGYLQKSMKFDRLFALFVTAPTVIEKYPLLGLGPGTFASDITGGGTSSRGVYPEYSHQDWLGIRKAEALQYTSDQGWTSILCQVGLLGLFCFAWMFRQFYKYAYLAFVEEDDPFRKGVALGFLALVVLMVFQNFVSFNLTYRAVSLYFWLFAGYIVAMGRSRREREAAGVAA